MLIIVTPRLFLVPETRLRSFPAVSVESADAGPYRGSVRIDVLLLALFFFLSVAAVPADAACAGGGYATGKSCTLAGVDYAGYCEGPASLQ